MRKALALVLLAAVSGFAVQIALASGGDSTNAEAQTSSVVPTEPCTPLRVLYSHRNWRDPHPARGENPCPGNVKKWKASHTLYREYRLVAPFRGYDEGDPWLKWLAVPKYVTDCETQGYHGAGRWSARNSSGAGGLYQLMPSWGAPYPANTPKEKVENHVIASHLSLSNWSCA